MQSLILIKPHWIWSGQHFNRIELSEMMKIFCSFPVQYNSYELYVASEHVKYDGMQKLNF